MVNFSNCLTLHSSSILSGSSAMPLTLTILSPMFTTLSGLSAANLFQASTAPPLRMPSMRRTRSVSEFERFRPRSAPSAFRKVMLKVPLFGCCFGSDGVNDVANDNWVRCGTPLGKPDDACIAATVADCIAMACATDASATAWEAAPGTKIGKSGMLGNGKPTPHARFGLGRGVTSLLLPLKLCGGVVGVAVDCDLFGVRCPVAVGASTLAPALLRTWPST
mmetsp:Transcript_47202/g.132736  ORF Transcript_47202/g.132736 Transcript_47202/m.132736 type:complete len:221 (-) Transcript_47202:515-1177(-)